ncbi:restriction endonuclease subunit S [Burkholderia cenocepacia]|uniref:restriction endonuclease subunit S n=1 Tax=Burkholderia cenocepacia TaxID=95486 RepID=UPI000F5BD198|nr:restriction endonuclease subunit S [Burkholderia cenocepacia]
MSRKTKLALVPRLRFPLFRDAGGWQPCELGAFLEEYSERVPASTELPIYSSTRTGLKLQKEYYDNRQLANDGEYGVVPEGLFVYRHMSDDGTFKFNINNTGGRIAVSKEYPVFSVVEMYPDFLLHLLNDGDEFKKFALAQKKGGTRTRLYLSILRTSPVLLPSHGEQQRIADCLSALDERIAAESTKLDTLNTHKEGLMQQLFARNGEEAAPQLRFPAFRQKGKWRKRKLSDLLTKSVRPVNVEVSQMYQEIGIRSHGRGVFHKDPVGGKALGDKRVFWVEENAFVVNIVFAWEQAVAVTSAAEAGMIASHRFPMYKPRDNNSDVNFIKYFFLTKKGKELLGIASPGGAGRNKTLGQAEFERLEFLSPESVAEQATIANALSSLDDLITAQARKIELLKRHKKGLVQRLFAVQSEGAR